MAPHLPSHYTLVLSCFISILILNKSTANALFISPTSSTRRLSVPKAITFLNRSNKNTRGPFPSRSTQINADSRNLRLERITTKSLNAHNGCSEETSISWKESNTEMLTAPAHPPIDSPVTQSRRLFLSQSCLAGAMSSTLGTEGHEKLFRVPSANAADNVDENRNDDSVAASLDKVLLRGTVSLQSGILLPEINQEEASNLPLPALYITARPNRPDNVPRAILDGSRGKPPPVLAARMVNPDFPLEFELTASDLTLEGAASTTNDAVESSTSLWWEGEDLIVSARWDTDGVAATRDPTDLVGRGLYSRPSGGGMGDVKIRLEGRGFTGKLVTNKAK